MDAARQRVERELHKVAEGLYKAQAEPAAPSDGGNGSAGSAGAASAEEGEVIDAEYTEEKGND